MVLPDVEEGGHRQLHPDHPAVLQGLAGHLHHHILASGVGGVEKMPLQVQRLRRGEGGGAALHPVVNEDGGQKAHRGLSLPLPPVVQNGL